MTKKNGKQAMGRALGFLDKMILQFDQGLRTVAGSARAVRPTPALNLSETPLSAEALEQSAGFMRVNHTGEICAQALYRGQLLTVREKKNRDFLAQAAIEETDHLAWCETRLRELGSHLSYFNPVWYSLSFFLGLFAGWLGDAWSLGFVEETEIQVGAHLRDHLNRLPAEDQKSHAIVQQMAEDELSHATKAQYLGAKLLPSVIQGAMRVMAKVMKVTAYRF